MIHKIIKIGKISIIIILSVCIIFSIIYYWDFFKKAYLAIASLFITVLAMLPFISSPPSREEVEQRKKELEKEKKDLEKEREIIEKQTEEESYQTLSPETKNKIEDIKKKSILNAIEKIKKRNEYQV